MQRTILSSRRLKASALATGMAALVGFNATQAGYILEVDTDGADDGVLTFHPDFSFGSDTTSAGQSVTSTAFGMTGGDSIFGGDAVTGLDTYVFTYDPSVDADNLVIPAGTDLGGGNLATGLTGGAPGVYAVFATWPMSANISGGLTTFDVSALGDSFSISLDQNNQGNEWIKLGEIDWTSGPITISQVAGANTFVSMRSGGMLFETVPEPSTLVFSLLGGVGLAAWMARRRRA